MKKINELLAERASLISAMETITANAEMTEELRSEWNSTDAKVVAIDSEIALLQRQEELNKTNARTMENTIETPKTVGAEFREFLTNAVNGNGSKSFEYRADPILTSTNTAVINKTVANSVDILVSPGEAFLFGQLGVTRYSGLNGNFVVPSMAQDLATFPGEDASAASANMAPESLTLAARRVTHTQAITKETLAQTNPAIYAGIVQNLINGIWNAVANDVFDTLESDAASQIGAFSGGPITYTDVVNMEASIGGLNIGAGAYVTTPAVKAFLKTTASLTNQGPIWMDNQVNGYPAFGVPAANTDKVYFGDFSRMAVGEWGGIEIVVDPYTKAKQGEIVLTAVALVDSGCTNKRAFAIMADASVV